MKSQYTKRLGIAAVVALAFTSAGVASAADGAGKKSATALSKSDKADLTDAQILGITDAANTGEVEQGNVAETRGQSVKVK
jgi:hypothetical protein